METIDSAVWSSLVSQASLILTFFFISLDKQVLVWHCSSYFSCWKNDYDKQRGLNFSLSVHWSSFSFNGNVTRMPWTPILPYPVLQSYGTGSIFILVANAYAWFRHKLKVLFYRSASIYWCKILRILMQFQIFLFCFLSFPFRWLFIIKWRFFIYLMSVEFFYPSSLTQLTFYRDNNWVNTVNTRPPAFKSIPRGGGPAGCRYPKNDNF